ncbi:hypothetical protein [Cellulomonas sp. HZM]|uniref:hypothetical protein n=1 Tax=Cellulomonas sp. HZM TaxID=1454010 RepID=UPI000AC70E16|nr:hypothetical protein [Cellulomonas sp. HZM]
MRVRRDAYVDAGAWEALPAADRYRLTVLASDERLGGRPFSHLSAAAVWRPPLIGSWPSEVHVVVGPRTGGRSWPGVVRHCTDLTPSIVVRDGVPVTDVATTVVDVARSAPFVTALAMADHALAHGLVTAVDLERAAARVVARRGSRAAARVVAMADGRAESVGESLSRGRMIELAAPRPELQHEVRDAAGLVGRCDFFWPELRLVGEFDGRLKYRADGVASGHALEERVWAEKVREDRLRATGLRVLRWTWSTALSPERFAALLREAAVL